MRNMVISRMILHSVSMAFRAAEREIRTAAKDGRISVSAGFMAGVVVGWLIAGFIGAVIGGIVGAAVIDSYKRQ